MMKRKEEKWKADFRLITLIGSALLVLTLLSCSLDYSDAVVDGPLAESIPTTILNDFLHTRVSNGRPLFRLYAEVAEVYEKKEETRLINAVFQEYDKEGNILTQGRADEAVFETVSENARITGNIIVYSARQETRLMAEEILWDNEIKQVTSGGETLVSLLQDNGSLFEGSRFKGDFRHNQFDFDGPVKGVYYLETEDEADK